MKSKSAIETRKLGEELGKKLINGGVVCLYGGLGAGKTTFVQGLVRGLGLKRRVNSPTFIVARQYKYIKKFFYHVDLYRLTSLAEARAVGIEEMWDNGNVVVIEWPEIIEEILPKHTKVKFININENEREIIY